MGVVFAATHLLMKTRVAIKWMQSELHESRDGAKRFVREARIAGTIKHPSLVQVYDVFVEENSCFMVMELLEGETLAQRIARTGPLSADQACEIFLPCMEGLAAAHAVGVVHRDLKPENIFLEQDSPGQSGRPRVLDFGVSRLVSLPDVGSSLETLEGTVIGTPVYMAPEQVRALTCDQRTDVYALGVTLYEALCGHKAIDADGFADLVLKVVKGEIVPLEERTADLPLELAAAVRRAIDPEPSRRFASVAEFAEALSAFQQIGPRERSKASRAPRKPVRHHHAFAVLGVVLALIALLLWLTTREHADRARGAAVRVESAPVVDAVSEPPSRVEAPAVTHQTPVPDKPRTSESVPRSGSGSGSTKQSSLPTEPAKTRAAAPTRPRAKANSKARLPTVVETPTPSTTAREAESPKQPRAQPRAKPVLSLDEI